MCTVWDMTAWFGRCAPCGTWQLGLVDVHRSFEGMCFFPGTTKTEAAHSLLSKLPQFPGTASCDNTECGNLWTAGGVLHQGTHWRRQKLVMGKQTAKICVIHYAALSNSDCIATKYLAADYLGICLEEQRKTTKSVTQTGLSPTRYLNSEYHPHDCDNLSLFGLTWFVQNQRPHMQFHIFNIEWKVTLRHATQRCRLLTHKMIKKWIAFESAVTTEETFCIYKHATHTCTIYTILCNFNLTSPFYKEGHDYNMRLVTVVYPSICSVQQNINKSASFNQICMGIMHTAVR
jgi:hypothetical protein